MNTSQKEAYIRRVQSALADAGTEYQADSAVKLVGWSIAQGERLPWWKYHKRRIYEIEGGYHNIHSSVMALTIGLLTTHPEYSLAHAAMLAGDEYRAGIRRQWDVGYGPEDAPLSLEKRASGLARKPGNDITEQDALDHILHLNVRAEETPPPFDETQMTDPRLLKVWELATEKERDVLRLVAEGVTVQSASQLLGGTDSLGAMRMQALRKKLKAAGVMATGPS